VKPKKKPATRHKSWTRDEALAIRDRVQQVVTIKCEGSRLEFRRRCDFTRDTADKWFGRVPKDEEQPRAPDAKACATIAGKCGVSLDWLLLKRGTMDWPRPATRQAIGQLYEAVYGELERLGDNATQHALERIGSGALWAIAVMEARELPTLASEAQEYRYYDGSWERLPNRQDPPVVIEREEDQP
jgi:hypothetical protein